MKSRLISLLGICFCLLPFATNAQQGGTVSIKGTVRNFSSQVMIEDLSDMQYLLAPDPTRLFVPGADGSFRITFAVPGPNYFRMGRNILYLTPGDDLTVAIDSNAPAKGEFSGTGSAANLYLRDTPFPKAGSYMEAGRNAKQTAKETVDFILAERATRTKRLEELQGVTNQFKRLEAARIKADTINSLLGGRISFYRPKISEAALKVYDAEYRTLSDAAINNLSKDFVDFSFMKLVVYRDIAADLVPGRAQLGDAGKIKDWVRASQLITAMGKVSDKSQLRTYAEPISTIYTPQYRDALNDRLNSLLKFGKGDIAVNFIAQDLSGSAANLDALKGKVIYLDLWATWCGPCVQEMPFFEKLKEKYKDNANIAFVSLSIDDDVPLWQKNVSARKADGLQWLINRNKMLDYNVVGIPRTIIIDKSFKIADLNAPLPSAKNTEKIIEDLLK